MPCEAPVTILLEGYGGQLRARSRTHRAEATSTPALAKALLADFDKAEDALVTLLRGNRQVCQPLPLWVWAGQRRGNTPAASIKSKEHTYEREDKRP